MFFESEYTFQNQPRLQLIFESPNHCGTILAILIVVLCGAYRSEYSRLTRSHIFSNGLIGILIGGSAIALAFTYSRGAWIATVIGLISQIIINPKCHKKSLLVALWVFLCIFFVPSGENRAKSVI